nr:hypothetical protein [Pyrinomonadaceae bacterium]
VYVRGNYQDDLFGRASQFPDTPSPDFLSSPKGLAANYTWTINSKMVNSFTYGLTREAFTDQGDSTENSISFRFVFSPRAFTRTLSRTTPVHNFTDDFSLTAGNHGLQFGTNIRLIRNDRTSFANSYDDAIANPSFYQGSGNVLNRPISGIGAGFTSPVSNAVSAVLGRFSQYSANFNFDREGNLLPAGTGIQREFATEEYDVYAQDVWRVRPNLTLTLGLRYGLSRPVYETSGLQVKPTVSLGEFFERRRAGAAVGRPVNDLITVDLAGPANDRPGYYEWDKNNVQPRIAFAYSPDFKSGFLHKLFGDASDSVIRGGFAMTNDYYGQQLAVSFDLNSTLGFSSAQTISANSYNVTTRPAPLFTGFGQNVRALPRLPIPGNLTFPLTTPADEAERIESSLDDTLIAPTNYSWNVSFERQMPAGLLVSASYIGRSARALLGTRDIMHLNNLVDPRSGVDWYTAAGQLADLRSANTPIGSVQPIPYFENLFPGIGSAIFDDPILTPTQAAYSLVARDGEDILDWTYVQSNDLLDDLSILGPNAFFHPQYAAFATFSNIGSSDYHAGTLSVRQRLGRSLLYDFNYTLSKSMDTGSGLQSSTSYDTAFIINPLSPDLNRSVSDFDLRHIVNANAIWQLPVGRGRALLGDSPGFIDAIIGGWQLSGIYRWNSGRPVQTPFDASQWATNWNAQSNGVRIRPLQESPTRGGTAAPNLFSDPTAAYRSFRNARAGEVGDRNVFRRPGYIVLDAGLSKSFTMPWSESHTLQFRAEVFNVTNTQRMGTLLGGRDGLGLGQDPDLNDPQPAFGNFTEIQGAPRVMQFGLRYQF